MSLIAAPRDTCMMTHRIRYCHDVPLPSIYFPIKRLKSGVIVHWPAVADPAGQFPISPYIDRNRLPLAKGDYALRSIISESTMRTGVKAVNSYSAHFILAELYFRHVPLRRTCAFPAVAVPGGESDRSQISGV